MIRNQNSQYWSSFQTDPQKENERKEESFNNQPHVQKRLLVVENPLREVQYHLLACGRQVRLRFSNIAELGTEHELAQRWLVHGEFDIGLTDALKKEVPSAFYY